MEPVFLRGERVSLFAIDPEADLTEYASWVNDQDATRYMGSGRFPVSASDIRTYVANFLNDPNGVIFGVRESATGQHVGNIALNNIDWVHRKGEVGILIGSSGARGKGYGAEALRLLVGHAFSRLGLNKLTAGYVDGNEGSKRLFESVGFKTEGVLKEDFFLEGEFLDSFRVALLRSDWERASA